MGVDYLEVCRRARDRGVPRAAEAVDALTAVLSGRAQTAGVVYPCTVPSGVRWFRAEVFRAAGVVAVRHVDVTASWVGEPDPATADLVVTAGRVLSEAGLLLAVADALDGPPGPAVVVLATAVEETGPGGVAPTDVARHIRASGVAVDLVAQLGARGLAVLVTAPDEHTALRTADDAVHATATLATPRPLRWGVAVRTAGDDAVALLARARRSLLRAVDHPAGPLAPDVAEHSERLQRAAAALVAAVDDFDRALGRGVPLPELVVLDRAVVAAEQAVAAAASGGEG